MTTATLTAPAPTSTAQKFYNLEYTDHNINAIKQAYELAAQFEQDIYCIIDPRTGNISWVTINEKPTFGYYIVIEYVAKTQYRSFRKRLPVHQENIREQQAEKQYNYQETSKGKNLITFTFEVDGDVVEAEWSRKEGSLKGYYRIPYTNIKAESFYNLVKKYLA